MAAMVPRAPEATSPGASCAPYAVYSTHPANTPTHSSPLSTTTNMLPTPPLALLLATAATLACAAETRDVYSPPVLYPHAGTVWYSGQRHNVTWCAPSFLCANVC